MNATELRKQFFPALESVAGGTPVDFTYKGQNMQIISTIGTSKLARLRPQTYTLDSEREIEEAEAKLKDQLQAEWLAKWDKPL